MEVVITHPNGWSLREESFLRLAAVTAGFSTPGQASKRISFVTETEASVHFYIHYSNLGDVLRPGMNFAICEADDSIVKSTLYSVISMRPTVKLREQRATVCTQAGSAFVGLEAEKFLRKSLENIGLPVDRVVDYTRAGVEDFRRITARLFMDEASTYSIAFAPISFNNPAINTRRGRMMVPGVTIKGFFDVYVKQIMESVDQQLDFNAARRALLEIVLTYVKSFESVTNHKDVELSSQMTPRPKRLQKGQLFGKSHMGAQTALCNSHGV
ncbi:unnamed protein product [Rhizoctonia solani]|nr:unnamed protein product [Rhizoctonia solani]